MMPSSMANKIFKTFLLFFVLIGFVHCTQKKPLDNETLYFNLRTEPPSLDPSKATDVVSFQITENIFDGLADYDISTPQLEVIPKIAKSWKVSPDGRVYTFYLRSDVLWSDGKKVTAHDFEYSWKRLIDPKTASEYAYFLFDIKNAQAFSEGKIKNSFEVGIKALNESTFQVTLHKPVAYFLHVATFASLAPLRKDVIEKFGDTWTEPEHIITNGPFKLTSWEHDYQIIFERNENYYGPKAKLKKIHCLMVSEQSTALSLYQTKKLDIIVEVPPLDIPRLKKTSEFHSGNFLSTYYVGINTKKAPLTNPNIRKALASAVDRKQITEILQKGDIPSTSLIPMGMLGYNANIGLPFDVNAAQEFMKKAGYDKKEDRWVHAKTKEPFPSLAFMYNTNEAHKTVAESLQAQWKKNLGIDVSLDNQEWKVYNSTLQSSHKTPEKTSYNLFRLGWNADYPDPDNYMSLFTSYSANNHTHWGDKKFDTLTEKAKSILNPKQRLELYNQTQKLLLEDGAAIIPLFVYAHQAMWRDTEVKGIKLNPLDKWYFDQIWLERTKN